MDAIFFKNNIYVLVKRKNPIDKEKMENDPSFIGQWYTNNCKTIYLYGNRVCVKLYNLGCEIFIDGVGIEEISTSLSIKEYLSPETCVAYLNQIENLGIDTFLEIYKKSLSTFKSELENQKNQISQNLFEQADKEKMELLKKIEFLLSKIVCLIFVLSIHMNVGLDNHVYTDTYNFITNQFFQ